MFIKFDVQFLVMKKWVFLLGCIMSFSALTAQPATHMQYVTGHTTHHGTSLPALPVLFNHGSIAGLPANGEIAGELNNKPLFKSAVRNMQLHGSWQSWYQDGVLCDSGTLYKGIPNGTWKHWDEQGNLIALRTYSVDKYQRVTNAMLRHHPKRADYPLAELYAKNRKQALYAISDAASFPGATGVKTHTIRELVKNNITGGNNYKPVFNRALLHGVFVNYFSNGAIKDSGYYQNGLKHGLWQHTTSGETAIGTYKHGIRVKEWRTYNASGKIIALTVYSNTGKIRKARKFN